MKKTLFTVVCLIFVIGLSAQLRPKPTQKAPVNKGQIILNEPFKADAAMTKCERHMKYHKMMWRTILNANPTDANPLELSKEISRLRFLPGVNVTGNLVFDKTPGAVAIPPIAFIQDITGYNPFPFPATGTTVLIPGHNSPFGFHWETGNYGNIKEVKKIYKTGNQHFIEVENTNGEVYTIKVAMNYLSDGCAIPST